MSSKSSKTDNLEKQLDAAIDAGLVPDSNTKPVKRGRGRPSTKSQERQPVKDPEPSTHNLMPEEKKIENEKKVQQVIANTKKTRLILQLQAFSVYFPDITKDAMQSLNIHELDARQLEELLKCFRDSVLGKSEILALPIAIKKVLGKVETAAVSFGMSNPSHPVIGEFIKMNGLTERINADQEIDDNVKLIAVDMAGRLPRNPYFNIIAGIWRCALDQYNDCSVRRPPIEVEADPKYSKLSNNNEQ